ncbi:MAG TPA: FISUMP domain-containing protein [Vicinamibacterales bacterium]|nr:FISUMP domain-containing protein [Vicinamibacterales bacterium]
MTPFRSLFAAIALSLTLGSVAGAGLTQPSGQGQNVSGANVPFQKMADGKEWTANLSVDASPSFCYADEERNCTRYGRWYTWASAQQVCGTVGKGWRLPTDADWRQLAKRYGGVSNDSTDGGKAAFAALLSGGSSGFDAVLGGNRSANEYARLEAHGLYWTASENDSLSAPFYNFARNGGALHRQPQGDKTMAISVRCVRE